VKEIPLILEGKDVVVRAKIGSEKTLSYLLPLLHKGLVAADASSSSGLDLQASVGVQTREPPQNSRKHILQRFNMGLFEYLYI
jgi:ATP-dependent RNA helicase DDX56/DBP9